MPAGEDPAGGPQEERDNLNALTERTSRAQIWRRRLTCRHTVRVKQRRHGDFP